MNYNYKFRYQRGHMHMWPGMLLALICAALPFFVLEGFFLEWLGCSPLLERQVSLSGAFSQSVFLSFLITLNAYVVMPFYALTGRIGVSLGTSFSLRDAFEADESKLAHPFVRHWIRFFVLSASLLISYGLVFHVYPQNLLDGRHGMTVMVFAGTSLLFVPLVGGFLLVLETIGREIGLGAPNCFYPNRRAPFDVKAHWSKSRILARLVILFVSMVAAVIVGLEKFAFDLNSGTSFAIWMSKTTGLACLFVFVFAALLLLLQKLGEDKGGLPPATKLALVSG